MWSGPRATFSLAHENVPDFLAGLRDRVLQTGKYTAVLRDCELAEVGGCNSHYSQQVSTVYAADSTSISASDATPFRYSQNEAYYIARIDKSYQIASRKLLDFFLRGLQLRIRLKVFQAVFFMAKADWVSTFLVQNRVELEQVCGVTVVSKLEIGVDLALRHSSLAAMFHVPSLEGPAPVGGRLGGRDDGVIMGEEDFSGGVRSGAGSVGRTGEEGDGPGPSPSDEPRDDARSPAAADTHVAPTADHDYPPSDKNANAGTTSISTKRTSVLSSPAAGLFAPPSAINPPSNLPTKNLLLALPVLRAQRKITERMLSELSAVLQPWRLEDRLGDLMCLESEFNAGAGIRDKIPTGGAAGASMQTIKCFCLEAKLPWPLSLIFSDFAKQR